MALAGLGVFVVAATGVYFYGVKSRVKVCNALPGPASGVVYFNRAPAWPSFLEKLWGYDSDGKDAIYVMAETGRIDAGRCRTLVSRNRGFARNTHAYFIGSSEAWQLRHIYDVDDPVLTFGDGFHGVFEMAEAGRQGRLPKIIKGFARAGTDEALPEFTRISFGDTGEHIQVMSVPETQISQGPIAEKDVETELQNARRLNASLKRWEQYAGKDEEDDWPFTLGVKVSDENGRLRLGIRVTSSEAIKPTFQTPLRSGDWIVRVAGTAVFHEKDMYAALRAHGSKHGVEKTFPVVILRGDQMLAFETVYYFSEGYYGHNDTDRKKAAALGFVEAATLGAEVTAICSAKKSAEYLCGGAQGAVKLLSWLAEKPAPEMRECPVFDFDQCYFDNIQYVARLMQMYPKEFKGAGFVGMFVPTTRLLALGKIGIANKILNGAKLGKIRGLPKAVMAEMADAAIWETLRAKPGMSASGITQNIKRELPYAAGIGFVTGILTKTRR